MNRPGSDGRSTGRSSATDPVDRASGLAEAGWLRLEAIGRTRPAGRGRSGSRALVEADGRMPPCPPDRDGRSCSVCGKPTGSLQSLRSAGPRAGHRRCPLPLGKCATWLFEIDIQHDLVGTSRRNAPTSLTIREGLRSRPQGRGPHLGSRRQCQVLDTTSR